MFPVPARDYRFVDRDLVAVIGARDQLEAFRALAIPTPRVESLVEGS